jgi:GT2 family glycosyltransferase
VVIVNYNTAHLLDRLFAAIEAARGSLKLEIIVVDNSSTDNSVELLERRYPSVSLVKSSKNLGFGRANNLAVRSATGRYILLLNTDAFIAPDSLEMTLSFMEEHPSCGVLGVRLVNEDGILQPSCRYFPTPWNVFLQRSGLSRLFPSHRLVDDMEWDHGSVRQCDWVPGCFYLVRKEVIERIGLFDSLFFLYFEEVDHCRSVKTAGWDVVYYPYTQVVHIGGESAKSANTITKVGRQISALQTESELLYFRKYYGFVGLMLGALLSIVADLLIALNGLIRRFDLEGFSIAWRHISSMLRLLGSTRLATHSTR